MFGTLFAALSAVWANVFTAANPPQRHASRTARPATKRRRIVRPNFFVRTMRLAAELRLERQHREKLAKLNRRNAAQKKSQRPSYYLQADFSPLGVE